METVLPYSTKLITTHVTFCDLFGVIDDAKRGLKQMYPKKNQLDEKTQPTYEFFKDDATPTAIDLLLDHVYF